MVIEEHARLEVTLPDGRHFDVQEDDIIQNSLSVTSQCVNGNTFGFGCVSPAQLAVKFRLKSANIGRYDVYGAEIILYSYFGNAPSDDGGKRGVFNVTSVTKNKDIFTVSASDNICWLDNSAFSGESNSNLGNSVYKRLGSGGNLWSAMSALGIIVGEFSGSDIKLGEVKVSDYGWIPNASPLFNGYEVPEKEHINYYERQVLLLDGEQSDNIRDYVAWLAEYMGGFVYADKNGTIQFSLFENASKNSLEASKGRPNPEILDFSEFQQNTLEIAGFRIRLNSAKLITEDNYCHFSSLPETGIKSDIHVETVVKSNPFVEFIYRYRVLQEGKDLSPITGALMYYQHWIQIRPFSGTYHGNKYLYLGQRIKIMDEHGEGHETTITNITWKFRGGQQIKCVGEDSRTLSQARKRTQAVRMGERMKTQINRLEDTVSKNQEELSNKIGSNKNDISSLDSRIGDLKTQVEENYNSLSFRVWTIENSNYNGRLESLEQRVSDLESGG